MKYVFSSLSWCVRSSHLIIIVLNCSISRYGVGRVWRYQRGNQNPYVEEEQKTQWPTWKHVDINKSSMQHVAMGYLHCHWNNMIWYVYEYNKYLATDHRQPHIQNWWSLKPVVIFFCFCFFFGKHAWLFCQF
jgi:hypothetical protein